MKIQNLLYVTLVVAVVSLFSVTPVFANEGMHCLHTEHTIQSLRNCVAHAAEMRHIENRGRLERKAPSFRFCAARPTTPAGSGPVHG